MPLYNPVTITGGGNYDPSSVVITGGSISGPVIISSTSQVDFASATYVALPTGAAPNTQNPGSMSSAYGDGTSYLGIPNGWMDILISGIHSKVPYYQ